jgi:hypothetical protein
MVIENSCGEVRNRLQRYNVPLLKETVRMRFRVCRLQLGMGRQPDPQVGFVPSHRGRQGLNPPALNLIASTAIC